MIKGEYNTISHEINKDKLLMEGVCVFLSLVDVFDNTIYFDFIKLRYMENKVYTFEEIAYELSIGVMTAKRWCNKVDRFIETVNNIDELKICLVKIAQTIKHK